MGPLISLTYLSTATVAFTDDQLQQLLADVRQRNHDAELTGMLLYAGGHFIQTLEGPAETVDATFARIERDSRHRNLIVALREEIDQRCFPDWSMGFETLDEEQTDRLPGLNSYLSTGALTREECDQLGRAGIFHRVFRNNMR